jgi:hypothetical protein
VSMSFDEFADDVARVVQEELDGGDAEFDVKAKTWRRGRLSVSLAESGGKAVVSYIAEPGAHFGHSSSAGMSHDLSVTGVDRAAREVISALSNRNLYE